MIIIQGVFRSGTSTLFRALRRDDAMRCYYEPLHPNLLDHIEESDTEHPSHPKSPLYAEYTPLLEDLRSIYRSDLALRNAILPAHAQVPALQAYLDLLSESAPRVVLQFNRAFWMSEWLHERYPDASFIHLVRDPRSVVWSQLTTRSGQRVRMEFPFIGRRIFNLSSGNLANVFASHAYHGAYHVRAYYELGCERLSDAFPDEAAAQAHADLSGVEEAPPFVQALALWGAQVRVCHHQARRAFGDRYTLLRYEELCESPAQALARVYGCVDRALPQPVGDYGTEQIHARRLAPWQTVDGARERFEEGIEAAGIADLVAEFDYGARSE